MITISDYHEQDENIQYRRGDYVCRLDVGDAWPQRSGYVSGFAPRPDAVRVMTLSGQHRVWFKRKLFNVDAEGRLAAGIS